MGLAHPLHLSGLALIATWQRGDISTGTEIAVTSCQHQATILWVGLNLDDKATELVEGLEVKGVLDLRAIKASAHHSMLAFY